LIDAEKATYPVTFICGLLGVSRSSFYAWRNRVESATAARRRELAEQVRRVFDAHAGRYGCRRVAAALNRDGYECSVGLVADLMRELGLRACQPRAYKRTTVPGPQPVASPDLIGGNFTAAAPGQRLVGDITYLKTGEGWLYLATVIDLCTRMVVGWQLANHLRTGLVTDALQMAITHGHAPAGAVFHSDRGCQGGFNWSTQHLGREVLVWADVLVGRQLRRGGRRCVRRVGLRSRAVSIGSGSGRRSRAGSPVRAPGSRPACPRRWAVGGFASVAACRRLSSSHTRAGICRSGSGRRSRFVTPMATGFARSRPTWTGRRRRSPVSCAQRRHPGRAAGL